MLIAAAAASLLLLSLAAIAFGRVAATHRVVYAGCVAATTALWGAALVHLFTTPPESAPTAVLPLGLPWLQAHFRLDSLTAFFMALVNGGAMLASLFAIGYGTHAPEYRRVTPLYPLFLFGMNAVLLADDAFMFLVAWEFMSLASWLLVLSDHRRPESRAAGRVYLIMAVFGTLCLLPAFGLLAGHGGDYAFATMRVTELAGVPAFLVVLLTLLGTGSKAGLAPLHAWLPLAHPAAPSHVSALMSGVMTKVALYAMIRILFDLDAGVDWRWGAAMMVAGGITAVLGVLYALMQTDLKRLLAYSTVENVGVIVVGLGLAIAFRDQGEPLLAALALVAALYHALNHSMFKSLLFLGAGAVLSATHHRELGRLGGLLKRMPVTGTAMLVGAAAASSLPPLNGFVSEWLILQALFRGPALPDWTMKFGVPVVAALMALAAALAAGCFVRAYGVAFLGRPRSEAAAQAVEVELPLQVALAALAALCVVLGFFPVTVTTALAHVVEPLVGTVVPAAAGLGWPWLAPVDAVRGSYSATVVAVAGVLLLGAVLLAVRRAGSPATRRADAWGCGHDEPVAAGQYGPESFAQPWRRVFGTTLFRAREEVEMPPPGDTAPARLTVRMSDPVWEGLYLPLGWLVNRAAEVVNRLQSLTVRRYLLLMFVTVVGLLVVVVARQQLLR